MADNNAAKGIGFLAILSLLGGRVCVRSCDDVAQTASRGFDIDIKQSVKMPEYPKNSGNFDNEIRNKKWDFPDEAQSRIKGEEIESKGKSYAADDFLRANPPEESSTEIENSLKSKQLEIDIDTKYQELKNDIPNRPTTIPTKENLDKQYNEYKNLKEKLNTAFLDHDIFYLNFLTESYNFFQRYNNIISRLNYPNRFEVELFPEYLIEPTGKINLNTYYLYNGFKFNLEQQKIITEVTSYGFTNSRKGLGNCILIEKQNDDYIFRTINNETKVKDINMALNNASVLVSKNILIKNDISQDLIEFLRQNKVKIVADATKYLEIINLKKQKIKYFIVNPEHDYELIKMYGIKKEQIKDLRIMLNEFASTPNTVSIRSLADLENNLNKSFDDSQSPVLIFNNANGDLFGKPLKDHFNVKNVITCNSISLENTNLTFNSTDYLYIKQTFNALRKTDINNEMRLDEFYSSFSKNYNDEVVKSSNNIKFNVVLLSVGGTGVLAGAVYLGNKEKK